MLRKLKASLPIFLELIGDKPVDEILQNDVNVFFDNAQKLPARRFDEKFKGKSLKQIISLNKGDCISEKTFTGTYVATVSVFLEWAKVHYSDQGFKPLSVKGGLYRGTRSKGINKQRAIKPDELKILFGHEIMKGYVDDPKTAHYCWLPLIGLYTGARINEVCQLNPFTDIVQDADTGIWYFHFTDEGETAFGVDKSIKTKSSIRVVPIHSKLIELGFLDYVKKVGAGGHKIIFPKWAVRNGKASANSTKWFSRYLIDSGLKDETKGAKLIGFHAFRHTFITYASKNKIEGIQAITGHEEGDKKSSVFRGYITKDLTDGLTDKQVMIEKFDFGLELYKPNSKF